MSEKVIKLTRNIQIDSLMSISAYLGVKVFGWRCSYHLSPWIFFALMPNWGGLSFTTKR